MRLIHAAALACALVAGPVAAQTHEAEDYEAIIAELDAALPVLARAVGRPVPASVGPIFRPLFETVLEERPDEPDAALILGFTLNGNPGETAQLLPDVAACAALLPDSTVLRFRRFHDGAAQGHECVLTGPGDAEFGGWVLMAETVTNAPEGRLNVRFGAASASESGGSDAARRMIDLHRQDLLAVADRIAVEARGVFLGEPAAVATHVDAPIDDDARQALTDIQTQFAELGRALGVEVADLPEGLLTHSILASTPRLAVDDPRDWGSSFDFDVVVETTTGTLETLAEVERAEECLHDFAGPAVGYEVLTMGGFAGHQCVFEFEEDGVVATYSRIILEEGARRITVIHGVAMSTDGDPADTRRLIRETRPAAVALAQGLARHAVAVVEAGEGGTVDPDAAMRWIDDTARRWGAVAAD
jgi:hypothetical protein